ncbi:unnamed protein product [Dimorphilus gyrociliatus]|uniref:Trans-1,2-dihydrobenzene-1,2-diol dehydrogenase n=1 Tax=Dimorphilus gyrociliatus TaxID=2664684 RepID=A0A7I8W500_9ANNE|nr:unnamed protein product [Dimorphilus gyrociliatus]
MAATRWGIISAGRISSDFATCLTHLPDNEHIVTAVAARNLDDANAFAKRFNIPKTYGSYDEIADDNNIDVYYIGTIHPTHHPIALNLINKGKNVLCEKPLCMNVKETKELVEAARKNKVFLMEGFWSRFFPVYEELRSELKAGSIGTPVVLTCTAGINAPNVPRLRERALGGSSLLDLGCYLIQLALLVFGEKPIKITASGHLFESGVDSLASYTLLFKNGGAANLLSTCTVEMKNVGRIFGTKGSIEFPKFHAPTEIETPSGKKSFDLPNISKPMNFPNSTGFCYEAQAVREALLQGKTEHELMPLNDTISIAEIMEEILAQIGVTY